MKKMLITGGTVFVSQFAAGFFSEAYDVYVLNRNTRPQVSGVTLIQGDRHTLGDSLRDRYFDVVLDITAYNDRDVNGLLDALRGFGDYILISSSAVYPELERQPFGEGAAVGPNSIWGQYGTDKIKAEQALHGRFPNGYILRPPYLYGPGNNVYREAFVFDCAMEGRAFFLPGNGEMKLQFFHVEDLCRMIACILKEHPQQRIFNVGNPEPVTIREWVRLCYRTVGRDPGFVSVGPEVEQRQYFPFYSYEYALDVTAQCILLKDLIPLEEGLQEAYQWYQKNESQVRKKPLIAFIEENLQ